MRNYGNKKSIRRLSISRSGLKTDTLDVDRETIALYLPNDKEDSENVKKSYQDMMKLSGIDIEHQKDIHYKRPFWKFWGMRDHSIAVFKIKGCNEAFTNKPIGTWKQ